MLIEQKQKVMDLRYDEEIAKLAVDSQQMAVQKTAEYRMLESAKAELQKFTDAREVAEEELRREALDQYAVDGNRTPVPGIVIRLFDVLVYNAAEASAWCKANAPYLFKFDAKAFEKAKPDGAPFTVRQDPRCQLASKLE